MRRPRTLTVVWTPHDSAFNPATTQETRQWVNGPYRFETLPSIR
ncbi:hypothetical protein ABZ864_24420 [Streptomyces sp. NPDC047082]